MQSTLDDVQVLGEWNFTMQTDTPLFWLRTGSLERYLLRFTAKAQDQPATFGVVFHAEADGSGTDGCSFWIERAPRPRVGECTKRYCLAGDALESKPVITRNFPDTPGYHEEDVKVLIQGYNGCIFLQDKKVQIKFRLKNMSGSVAFFNTSKEADVSFAKAAITVLRRGPMEIAGILGNREKQMLATAARTTEKATTKERLGEAVEAEAAVGLTGLIGGAADSKKEIHQAGTNSSTAAAPTGSVNASGVQSTSKGGQSRSASVPFRATAPIGKVTGRERGGPPGASRTWGQGQPFRGAARLRQSGSDSVLRKSGAIGGGTMPLALNPHKSEQAFMRETNRRELEKGTCKDFISIPVHTWGS
jgi:hypothetical protein